MYRVQSAFVAGLAEVVVFALPAVVAFALDGILRDAFVAEVLLGQFIAAFIFPRLADLVAHA